MEKEKNRIPVGAKWSNKYHLCPDWDFDTDNDEMEFTLYEMKSDFKAKSVICTFTAPYRRNGMTYDVSEDGKHLLVNYKTKYGMIMYLTATGEVLWQNKKIKKVQTVRFNQANPNILEIIKDDLDIVYLHSTTGEPVLENEKMNIIQKVNDFYVSFHRKKLLTVDCSCTDRPKAIFTVYDCKTQKIDGRFVGPYTTGGSRAAVTDDGKYAACAAYQKEGFSLIDVDSGETMWHNKSITRIQNVQFSKDESQVIITNNDGKVSFFDIKDGKNIHSLQRNAYYVNIYDADIEQIGERKLKKEKKSYVTTNGKCFKVICTKHGILARCISENFFFDYTGKLLWQSERSGTIAYIEEYDTIQCCVYDESKISPEPELLVISVKDGTILKRFNLSTPNDSPVIHIENNILCRNGAIYDINGNEPIKTGIFHFRIQNDL